MPAKPALVCRPSISSAASCLAGQTPEKNPRGSRQASFACRFEPTFDQRACQAVQDQICSSSLAPWNYSSECNRRASQRFQEGAIFRSETLLRRPQTRGQPFIYSRRGFGLACLLQQHVTLGAVRKWPCGLSCFIGKSPQSLIEGHGMLPPQSLGRHKSAPTCEHMPFLRDMRSGVANPGYARCQRISGTNGRRANLALYRLVSCCAALEKTRLAISAV